MDTNDAGSASRTVLVTGGSGYLGGWCVVELLRHGYRVRTTVRNLSREANVRSMIATQVEDDDRLSVVAADLMADAGWNEALDGCSYVLHVASPFPSTPPKDPRELITPAVEGTKRVVQASHKAGVERLVITSSVAAAAYGTEPSPAVITEADWTDINTPLGKRAYVQSKTLAERAAWDFARENNWADHMTSVLPGTILGPVLGKELSYSVQAVQRLTAGKDPGVPNIGFPFVDVRDVAHLHVSAMTAPQAAGQRFLATGDFTFMIEIARILRAQLGTNGEKVPLRTVPNVLIRALALFDPSLRQIVGELGKTFTFSTEKAETVLGWSRRPLDETVVECARSLLHQSN